MTIAFATPLYPPKIGGPSKYAKALHDEFKKRGFRVPVVTYGALERALPFGIRHLAYFCRLIPSVLRSNAVLAFDTWSVGFPALIAAKLFGKKYVVRIGGDFLWELYVGRTKEMVRLSEFYSPTRKFSFKERCIRAGTRYLLRHADVLAFNTSWQQGIWQRAYGFPKERAYTVENYFPAKRDFGEAKNKSFVCAGREHPLKNQALLEEVFARIQIDFPTATLDSRVLEGVDHHMRMKDAYAVVIASVSEVNPNLAIDAIMAGKPFIMPSDSGGYERLKDICIGIDTRDSNALEGAIRTLLDPRAYQEYLANVRAFTYTHTWEQVAEEFLALLQEP